MNNNPVRYTDPSGHMAEDDADGIGCIPQDLVCQIKPGDPVDLHLVETVTELVHDQFSPSLDGAPNLVSGAIETGCQYYFRTSGCGDPVVNLGIFIHGLYDIVGNSSESGLNTNPITPTQSQPVSTITPILTPTLNIPQAASLTATPSFIPTVSPTSSMTPNLTLEPTKTLIPIPTPTSPYITITPTILAP